MARRLNTLESAGWGAVVIGAGPAGCLSAGVLASRGVRTLLVDRARFPRAKVCGGCLAPAGVGALESAGFGHVLAQTHARPVSTLRVVARGAALPVPIEPYVTLERSRFDAALAAACEERGVVFCDGVAARVFADDRVELDAGDQRVSIEPGVVVVADGLSGTALSRRSEFSWRVRGDSPVGIGAVLDARPGHATDDAITMVCGRGGYVGVAPLPAGRWALAAAVAPAAVREAGPAGAIDAVLGESGLGPVTLGGARLRGVGNLTRRRAASSGRVLVVGDAAGYVQPLTGEGMSWGLVCASVIGEYAEAAGSGAGVARSWERACRDLLWRRRAVCRGVCLLAHHPGVLAAVLRVGARLPTTGWASRRLCWGAA